MLHLASEIYPVDLNNLNCELYSNITVTGNGVLQETKLAATQLGADR